MSDWDQLVERGRALVEKHSNVCWELGDLALEVVPMVGQGGVDHGVLTRLSEYAEAIGITTDYLKELRSTANAFPPSARQADAASFTAHLILVHGGVSDCCAVIKKMADRARRRDRRVTCKEAREMVRVAGRYAGYREHVEVVRHERGLPGENTFVQADFDRARKLLKNSEHRRKVLRAMTVSQLGGLIDDAWAVLEAEKVAA